MHAEVVKPLPPRKTCAAEEMLVSVVRHQVAWNLELKSTTFEVDAPGMETPLFDTRIPVVVVSISARETSKVMKLSNSLYSDLFQYIQ
jgi:hypothetical protein